MVMATRKEIKEHLEIALMEIGEIKPWFDKEVNEWIFKHSDYPVEYGGNTPHEVIKNYPKYLSEFIKHRLNANLNPLTEKKTKGHGGKRPGAGRPQGSVKETSQRISLPGDLVQWFKNNPQAIDQARKLMRKRHSA
jgi:hypothetical protein